MRQITFAQAIHEGLETALRIDEKVLCYGLGVTDPLGVFGTTKGLHETFGTSRVFDMPTAENGMTGVAIGAALGGLKPVMTHQRVDFFLLAMDQLVNNAAKWHYMFGGEMSIPLTIRLIIGRGWGQGPTHSQNLHSWFTHIPGLKVVMPTTPADAKGLLLESIFDPNPVIFLEHRWLHNMVGEVSEREDFRVPLGKAHTLVEGNDLTIVSMSYMTVEALHAHKELVKMGLSVEIIDLKTLSPLDWGTLFASIQKTKRLLVLDTAHEFGSIASDIVAKVSCELFTVLKSAPQIVALENISSPTSYYLTKEYYQGAKEIVRTVLSMLEVEPQSPIQQRSGHHDVPGEWFKGPF